MVIAAHQANFLPNISFFNKMKVADKFVIITNIQFEKNEGWQQRHKILGPQGDFWLTVPVFGSQNQKLKEVRVNNQVNWRKKHAKTIQNFYSKTKYKDILSQFLAIYDREWDRLVDLNIAFINLIREILGIRTPLVVDEEVSGHKHTLIINTVKKHKGDTYLSGVGAKDYLDDKRLKELEKKNIKHLFVKKNLTASYPYSSLHYLLTKGKEWVNETI